MQEIELKFQIPPACRPALSEALRDAAGATTRLRARYFDTEDRLLARSAFALRLRQEGEGWVQTLKGRGDGLMTRLEHNAPLGTDSGDAAPALSLECHAGTPAGAALVALLARAGRTPADLVLQFSTDITRTHAEVHADGAVVELALDVGQIAGGGQTLPVWEIEFELVRGAPAGLLSMAYLWTEAFGLWLDARSKAERGDRLARGVTQGDVLAVRPVDAAQPWPQQVAVALSPVLALVGDVADDLASPTQRVALAQALGVLAQTLRADAQAAGAADTVAALAGMVFDAAIWRRVETQALWLSLLAWSLPDAR
ncbi:CYTH domain-containing protein [Sphaerotilus sp.]|uniref:CYTH domain-containing protein n=1 Tax=Sphaerotilus sp. TaxID=2093942 RepID=UPI002ACD6964|nr:CYTH domain-containing protein [Sphaerotilus sp.]MDZ7857989.1 CYTH domain-containing protein [Sphaerotilus sp.]